MNPSYKALRFVYHYKERLKLGQLLVRGVLNGRNYSFRLVVPIALSSGKLSL